MTVFANLASYNENATFGRPKKQRAKVGIVKCLRSPALLQGAKLRGELYGTSGTPIMLSAVGFSVHKPRFSNEDIP